MNTSILDLVKSENDVVLIRCIIKKDKGDYFKAISHQRDKYLIAKNKRSNHFEIGTDDTFYAVKQTEGILFKKVIYHPLSHKEYLDLQYRIYS